MSDATPCIDCPLRPIPLFLPQTKDELALVQFLKRREIALKEGDTLIHEGQNDTRLFTLLEGWAYRFKTLSDGPGLRRTRNPWLTTTCCQSGGVAPKSAWPLR